MDVSDSLDDAQASASSVGAEGAAPPLTGVKVVEFWSTAAGPYCAMLLADMGADVVKIEPNDGDTLRAWPPLTGGYSENFASLNRNKRSIVLDLKDPAAAGVARRIIAESDVVVENNRPGVMDRLGLGYEALEASHPSLVYCSISAYGQSGPRAREGGFDLTIQAAAGVMSVTGEPDGAPVKCGVPISDFASGLYAAFAVASAIAAVRVGRPGMHIDVPMFGCTLAIAAAVERVLRDLAQSATPGLRASAQRAVPRVRRRGWRVRDRRRQRRPVGARDRRRGPPRACERSAIQDDA